MSPLGVSGRGPRPRARHGARRSDSTPPHRAPGRRIASVLVTPDAVGAAGLDEGACAETLLLASRVGPEAAAEMLVAWWDALHAGRDGARPYHLDVAKVAAQLCHLAGLGPDAGAVHGRLLPAMLARGYVDGAALVREIMDTCGWGEEDAVAAARSAVARVGDPRQAARAAAAFVEAWAANTPAGWPSMAWVLCGEDVTTALRLPLPEGVKRDLLTGVTGRLDPARTADLLRSALERPAPAGDAGAAPGPLSFVEVLRGLHGLVGPGPGRGRWGDVLAALAQGDPGAARRLTLVWAQAVGRDAAPAEVADVCERVGGLQKSSPPLLPATLLRLELHGAGDEARSAEAMLWAAGRAGLVGAGPAVWGYVAGKAALGQDAGGGLAGLAVELSDDAAVQEMARIGVAMGLPEDACLRGLLAGAPEVWPAEP